MKRLFFTAPLLPALLLVHCNKLNDEEIEEILREPQLEYFFGDKFSRARVHTAEMVEESRSKRATENADLVVRLDWEDHPLTLTLNRNHVLIPPHLTFEVIGDNGTVVSETKIEDKGCFYQGDISTGGFAAVDDCEDGGIRGVLSTPEGNFLVHPAPAQLRKRRDISQLHIITEYTTSIGECPVSSSNNAPEFDLSAIHTETDKLLDDILEEASEDLGNKVIEMGIFMDDILYGKLKKRSNNSDQAVSNLVLSMINGVQTLYKIPSMSQALDLAVVKLQAFKTANSGGPNKRQGEIENYLKSFCTWQKSKNTGTDSGNPQHWDHGIMLSGMDLYDKTKSKNDVIGVAWVAGMCQPQYSCTINEGTNFESVFVIAHEMGHNLGMDHDGSNGCSSSKFIMSPSLGPGKVTWSSCSVREMKNFMKKRQTSCLNDQPAKSDAFEYKGDGSPTGKSFSAKQQCKIKFGNSFYPLATNKRPYENICRELWCRNSTHGIRAHPALEGTRCANNKRCSSGKCVAEEASKAKYVAATTVPTSKGTTRRASRRSGSRRKFHSSGKMYNGNFNDMIMNSMGGENRIGKKKGDEQRNEKKFDSHGERISSQEELSTGESVMQISHITSQQFAQEHEEYHPSTLIPMIIPIRLRELTLINDNTLLDATEQTDGYSFFSTVAEPKDNERETTRHDVTSAFPEITTERQTTRHYVTSGFPETTTERQTTRHYVTSAFPETTTERQTTRHYVTSAFPETITERQTTRHYVTSGFPESTTERQTTRQYVTSAFPETTTERQTTRHYVTSAFPETTTEKPTTKSSVHSAFNVTTTGRSTTKSAVHSAFSVTSTGRPTTKSAIHSVFNITTTERPTTKSAVHSAVNVTTTGRSTTKSAVHSAFSVTSTGRPTTKSAIHSVFNITTTERPTTKSAVHSAVNVTKTGRPTTKSAVHSAFNVTTTETPTTKSAVHSALNVTSTGRPTTKSAIHSVFNITTTERPTTKSAVHSAFNVTTTGRSTTKSAVHSAFNVTTTETPTTKSAVHSAFNVTSTGTPTMKSAIHSVFNITTTESPTTKSAVHSAFNVTTTGRSTTKSAVHSAFNVTTTETPTTKSAVHSALNVTSTGTPTMKSAVHSASHITSTGTPTTKSAFHSAFNVTTTGRSNTKSAVHSAFNITATERPTTKSAVHSAFNVTTTGRPTTKSAVHSTFNVTTTGRSTTKSAVHSAVNVTTTGRSTTKSAVHSAFNVTSTGTPATKSAVHSAFNVTTTGTPTTKSAVHSAFSVTTTGRPTTGTDSERVENYSRPVESGNFTELDEYKDATEEPEDDVEDTPILSSDYMINVTIQEIEQMIGFVNFPESIQEIEDPEHVGESGTMNTRSSDQDYLSSTKKQDGSETNQENSTKIEKSSGQEARTKLKTGTHSTKEWANKFPLVHKIHENSQAHKVSRLIHTNKRQHQGIGYLAGEKKGHDTSSGKLIDAMEIGDVVNAGAASVQWMNEPGTCNVTCGGGYRNVTAVCKDGNEIVDQSLCQGMSKPRVKGEDTICNTEACPQWKHKGWSGCSVSCGAGERVSYVVCCLGEEGNEIELDEFECTKINKPDPKKEPCQEAECPTMENLVVQPEKLQSSPNSSTESRYSFLITLLLSVVYYLAT